MSFGSGRIVFRRTPAGPDGKNTDQHGDTT